MADYIDLLSIDNEENSENNENDDFMLSADQQSELLTIIHSNIDFVILCMNYKSTGILEIPSVISCIKVLFKQSNGIADIRQSAYAVISCIDNIEPYWIDLNKELQKLFSKYDNK
jgi:hypothetical protein